MRNKSFFAGAALSLILAACLNPVGLPFSQATVNGSLDGESGFVSNERPSGENDPTTLTPDNGILIVRNLSRSAIIDGITVTNAALGKTFEAGRVSGGYERSLVLSPGVWDVDVRWTRFDENGAAIDSGVCSTSKLIYRFQRQYLFFYRVLPSGDYILDDYVRPDADPDDIYIISPDDNSSLPSGVPWGTVTIINTSANRTINQVVIDGAVVPGLSVSPNNMRAIKLQAAVFPAPAMNHSVQVRVSGSGLSNLYFPAAPHTFSLHNGDNEVLSYPGVPGSESSGGADTGLGRLIIKNLTDDMNISAIHFTPLDSQTAIDPMEPGPARKNQKSLLLAPGDWDLSVRFPHGTSPKTRTVTITAGTISYLYFYKTNENPPGYDTDTQWLPPQNADPGNSNPGSIVGDDEGFLHVINGSQSAYITEVQYNSSGAWISVIIPNASYIPPRDHSDPDLTLPKGTWPLRFKTLGKDTYSRSVSRTINAGQTTNVEYTDILDADDPPSGFGTLRIVNNSPSPIVKVITRTRNAANEYPPVDAEMPVITAGTAQVKILDAGGATLFSQKSYIVQCYTAAATFYEDTASIHNGQITNLVITGDTPEITLPPGGGGTAGGITVYNKYSGPAPFKIFKIYLYRESGADTWGDGYAAPSSGSYPAPPTIGGQRYNGPLYPGEPFLLRDSYYQFTNLAEGRYKLLVVGGSYHWPFYTAIPANRVPQGTGIEMTEKRITYDAGSVFVTAGGTRIVNFDPYLPGRPDPDTPNGVVRINFLHAGNVQGTLGDSGPISRIQFIAGSEAELPTNYTGASAYVFDVAPANRTINSPQASATPLDHGGVNHDQPSGSGGTVPARFVVYEYNRGISPGGSIELYLPPGIYGVRVLNPQGDGLQPNMWFGRSRTYYFDLHLEKEAAHTINLQWKFPSIMILDDLVRDETFATVTDRSLTYKLGGQGLTNGTNLFNFVNNSVWSRDQWDIESYNWFYFPAACGFANHPDTNHAGHSYINHYNVDWYPAGSTNWAQYAFPVRVGTNGQLYKNHEGEPVAVATEQDGGTHGLTAKAGAYYTLEMTLRPKNGYTFRGISRSENPVIGIRDVNNQGTGFDFYDGFNSSTNGPGINNPFSNMNYRIRKFAGHDNLADWIISDGMISNTARLPGQDRIKVRIHFKRVQ
ncbi:MAG: hypothetical protein LBC88_08150 [Spirochaetaceae bacterium]|nr:hypothetical protein [Spirochaetaceae bacterium]